MIVRKEAISTKEVWKLVIKELEAITDEPEKLNTIQLEIVSKLVALRLSLNAPDFEEGHANNVLNQIYDNMYDLSESILQDVKGKQWTKGM